MAKQNYVRTWNDGQVERQVFGSHPGRTWPQWKLDEEAPKPKAAPKKKPAAKKKAKK